MAVNINTVYQKVLAFANKEQRGYITPQQFNLFADQAQNEIFDQYFYDLNQFSRVNRGSEEYADITKYIEEKINVFKRTGTSSSNPGNVQTNLYQLGTVWDNKGNVCEPIEYDKMKFMYKSRLLTPESLTACSVYTKRQGQITVYGEGITEFSYEYIKQPDKPSWTYVVVNGKAMYDPNNNSYQDFQLHHSEENELVYKILKYAGISIKQQGLVQMAQGMETVNTQQQKQ
jgi:hypothetical protein|tara:strand:- start:481 stop:1170 length:690 start_codon:yes stop_codon:yes gene_type:complete